MANPVKPVDDSSQRLMATVWETPSGNCSAESKSTHKIASDKKLLFNPPDVTAFCYIAVEN